MTYYLILDADYPPAGGQMTCIMQGPDMGPLIQKRSYDPAALLTAPWAQPAPAFVVSHDVNDISQPGSPLQPAAIYS